MTSYLRCGTYLYLGLPYAIFFIGWLRFPYSAFLIISLLVGSAVSLWSGDGAPAVASHDRWSDPRRFGAVLLPLLLVFLLCGVGGWGYQDTDWLRGNAVFRDLISKPWPVIYETESGPLLLVYYVAFYLPAALVGKLLGWQAANQALFVYGFIGLYLSALWVTRLTGVRRWWAIPVFVAFSGMDVIGALFRRAGELATGASQLQSFQNLEWWAGFGSVAFPSNIDLLVLTVNQAIPAWLFTALILNDAREERLAKTGIFYLGLCTLWAPYVCIGLLPFVVALLLPHATGRKDWRDLISWGNAAGLLTGLIVAGYLSSRYWPYTLPLDVSGLYQERLTLTLIRQGAMFLVIYPLFVALEFGVLHALLYGYLRIKRSVLDSNIYLLLRVSSVGLCILPWINMSWNNDLVMRACIPMLFVTLLVAVRVLDDRAASNPGRWLQMGVVGVLIVGCVNSSWIATRQVQGIYAQGALIAAPDEQKILTLLQLQQSRYDQIGYNFVGQYMGGTGSPFSEHIMAVPDERVHP